MNGTISKDPNISDHITLHRCPDIHLRQNTPKGRGVFATAPIPSGTILETSPVLLLTPEENKTHIEHTTLYHYTYNWPLVSTSDRDSSSQSGETIPTTKTQAVVLGLGSLFNHSSREQNVGWLRDLERQVIVYRALRNIAPGEELCISYGDRLTFVDTDLPLLNGNGNGDGEGEDEMLRSLDVDGLGNSADG